MDANGRRIELPTAECHLWIAHYDEVPLARLADYRAMLDASEIDRCGRFHFERDQHSYLISHALLRTVLSHYADVAPQDWRFLADRYGKPTIAEPGSAADLRFNLSHTRGAALVGVVRGADVGVDIETFDRSNDGDALAERYFSPAEVADLRKLPDDLRRTTFFEYWTLKESYIKARGLGLSLPLDQFSFAWNDRSISIAFDPQMNDRPDAWRFAKWRAGERFQGAAAVHAADAGPLRFLLRRSIPLVRVDEPSVLPTS